MREILIKGAGVNLFEASIRESSVPVQNTGTETSNLHKMAVWSDVKPVLNWANVCSPEHTSDTSTNYDSFLN